MALQPIQNWRNYMLTNYASRPFYLFGLAGFKLALCISYLRMTKGSSGHTYRRTIIAAAVFSTTSHMIFVLLYLCQCVPVRLLHLYAHIHADQKTVVEAAGPRWHWRMSPICATQLLHLCGCHLMRHCHLSPPNAFDPQATPR